MTYQIKELTTCSNQVPNFNHNAIRLDSGGLKSLANHLFFISLISPLLQNNKPKIIKITFSIDLKLH